jgi:hypothetical protein
MAARAGARAVGSFAGVPRTFPFGSSNGIVSQGRDAPGVLLGEFCGVAERFGHLVEQSAWGNLSMMRGA